MSDETDDDSQTERDEMNYVRGERSALTRMLAHVLGQLGVDATEAAHARWIIEREETVAKLREVCADFGDNDWPDNLHLGDAIEKHLARALYENSEEL